VEVLDELAAQVGFVAGDGGEMGGVEEEAFASDARYHGFEVRRGVFEAEDLGPERDEDELGRVARDEAKDGGFGGGLGLAGSAGGVSLGGVRVPQEDAGVLQEGGEVLGEVGAAGSGVVRELFDHLALEAVRAGAAARKGEVKAVVEQVEIVA
jgi:hypothetical protein